MPRAFAGFCFLVCDLSPGRFETIDVESAAVLFARVERSSGEPVKARLWFFSIYFATPLDVLGISLKKCFISVDGLECDVLELSGLRLFALSTVDFAAAPAALLGSWIT